MPFVASSEGTFGYGRQQVFITQTLPSYYTVNSGYIFTNLLYHNTSTFLQTIGNLFTNTYIKTYVMQTTYYVPYLVHDKDLDSNIFYSVEDTGGSPGIYKQVVPKGGGNIVSTILNINAPVFTKGCYAPLCMGDTSFNGAFIGGASGKMIVAPFSATKTIPTVYSTLVNANNNYYNAEVVPKLASGFSNNYAVMATAVTGLSSCLLSYTIALTSNSAGTWTNVASTSIKLNTNMIGGNSAATYYPPNKLEYVGDPYTASNRVVFTDMTTGSPGKEYIYKITESGTALVWTYLSTLTTLAGGNVPYNMSSNTYNSIS